MEAFAPADLPTKQTLYPGETVTLPWAQTEHALTGVLKNAGDRPGWAVVRCGSQMQTFTLAQEEKHTFLFNQADQWLTIRNAGSTPLLLSWQ
ncbi:MAG: hypothetical protein AAFQ98_12825 [Bacteroidota bacterium]